MKLPALPGRVETSLDRAQIPKQRGRDSAPAEASGRAPSAAAAPRSLEGLRVQLISLSYAPDTTGIAPYATSYAEMLRDNGAIVTVDAGVPHYPAWKVAPEYRWRRSRTESHEGIRIRRHPHAIPRRHGLIGRARYEVSFLLSLLVTRPVPTDVVIAVTPALAGAVAGAIFAGRAHVPLGVIVQDLVGHAAGQAGVPGGSSIARRLARMEARVLSRAQAIGVIAPAFRTALEAEGLACERFADLRNHTHIAPPIRGREETRRQLGWPLDRPIVLHSGNMGAKQDLLSVVAAARQAEARGDSTFFVLMGDGNQRRSIAKSALGLSNTRIQDAVEECRFPDALAAADVLLVNERATVTDMSLPSKLTSYFSSSRPVVAWVNPSGATAQEVKHSGAGIVVEGDSAGALLDAIGMMVEAGEGDTSQKGRQYVEQVLGAPAAEGRLLRFVSALIATR